MPFYRYQAKCGGYGKVYHMKVLELIDIFGTLEASGKHKSLCEGGIIVLILLMRNQRRRECR